MRAIRTNALEVGMYAALMMDLPNCKGIEVMYQGTIESVGHWDMWGVDSDTHTTVAIDGTMCTVHNSHIWLVRTIGN